MQENYKKDFKKRPFKKRHTRADFYLEGCPEGVKVPDGESGTLERAMKYLKRQLKDSEKLFLYKNKRYYEKPSHIKRVKMQRAKAMQKRADKIQERMYGKNQCWFVLTDKGAK